MKVDSQHSIPLAVKEKLLFLHLLLLPSKMKPSNLLDILGTGESMCLPWAFYFLFDVSSSVNHHLLSEALTNRMHWKLSIKSWHILYLWHILHNPNDPFELQVSETALLQIRDSGKERQPPLKCVLELLILWHSYKIYTLWQETISLLLGSYWNWWPDRGFEVSSLIIPFGSMSTKTSWLVR